MIRSLLQTTSPVFFGYVPMGMAFGVLFQDLGHPWWYATLMGLVIFAGSAQFLAVGLIAAGAGWVEVFLSTFLLNARHLFYGLSMLKRYGQWGLRKLYLIFGLTDETYALISSMAVTDPSQSEKKYFWITLFNQSYWVLGCTLGALLGAALPFDTQGMEFVMTALFTVLLIEQYQRLKESTPLLVAALSSLLIIIVLPEHMLTGSILLTLSILAILHRLPKDNA